jgi:SAM-dependent methyltransferase
MTYASPFDAIATDYDHSFSRSTIGKYLRLAVCRRLDVAFRPGERVLELNCGTGEDALHLARRGVSVLATDNSPGMLATTRAKVDRAGLGHAVKVAHLAIEDLALCQVPLPGPFDGVVSNFGGLNCVGDLAGVARGLAAVIRPGGRAVLCIMGPSVPWEWGWYLAHGQPSKAFRRLRRGGCEWQGLTVRYPSPGSVRRAFAPHFVQRRLAALGALMPPTYAEGWAARHPRLLEALNRWERRIETLPPLPWLADHFVIEFERSSAP